MVFTSVVQESDHSNRCGSLPECFGHSCSKFIFTGQTVSVTFCPSPSKFVILSDVTLYHEFSYHDV